MRIRRGKIDLYKGNHGVFINLSGDEVATAIDAYLVARGVHVSGARTIKVNGELCKKGVIFVENWVGYNGKDIIGKEI